MHVAWPGPESSQTVARLMWNERALYVCWELEGRVAAPLEEARVDADCLASLQGGSATQFRRNTSSPGFTEVGTGFEVEARSKLLALR